MKLGFGSGTSRHASTAWEVIVVATGERAYVVEGNEAEQPVLGGYPLVQLIRRPSDTNLLVDTSPGTYGALEEEAIST